MANNAGAPSAKVLGLLLMSVWLCACDNRSAKADDSRLVLCERTEKNVPLSQTKNCGTPQNSDHSSAPEPTPIAAPDNRLNIERATASAHTALLGVLRDPGSAVFNPQDGAAYSVNEDGSLYAVCGTVNSKNGFGGYTGDHIWIFVIPENAVYTEESGVNDAMALRDCAGGVHKAKARRTAKRSR
jgi:hypothetical protein